ncbi:hypothetical protein NP233_g1474 [Leucocoprinus birnbaumii]|uniref:Zinc finger C3HC4 RING-type domain-containing protein n=1 Tax=Leucocoprinus birnbaumii TaxID=56174 RepID=A0AAD5YZL8_9AGAR|nr:hypothetical protein NP233_g1474 [Leucocoprinus birnbaumii]
MVASASTSTLNSNNESVANDFLDVDTETSALIAEILYSDLQELASQRKGKSRFNAPLSDAEYALQLQSEQLEGMLTQIQDAEIAKRMQDAMRMDQALIEQMVLNEQVARQDHEAALALSRGEQLPVLTKEQRAVETGAKVGRDELSMDMFKTLSPNLKPTTTSASDKGKQKTVSFSPSVSSIRLPGPAFGAPIERPQCVSCDDQIPMGKLFLKAPCDHNYCMDCLANLVRAATTDESLFPKKQENSVRLQMSVYTALWRLVQLSWEMPRRLSEISHWPIRPGLRLAALAHRRNYNATNVVSKLALSVANALIPTVIASRTTPLNKSRISPDLKAGRLVRHARELSSWLSDVTI